MVKTESVFPEETFQYFCERVFKSYIDMDSIKDFHDLHNMQVCNFELQMEIPEKSFLEEG